MTTTTICGNTYAVKEQIKALGGRWNKFAKGWDVPVEKADAVRALVGAAPPTPMFPWQYVKISQMTGVGVRDCQLTADQASGIADLAARDKAAARAQALALPGAVELFDPAKPRGRKPARLAPVAPLGQRVDSVVVPPVPPVRVELPAPRIECEGAQGRPLTLSEALAQARTRPLALTV